MDWERLAGSAFTYAEHGATTREQLPAGYHHMRRQAQIGSGRAVFDAAGQRLLEWGMHRRAGLAVTASEPVAGPGVVVRIRLGPLSGTCRVVYVVNEPDRRGFAYGTLPGHPEIGEEYFGVRFDPSDQAVYAEVVAFSRPGQWWSQLGAGAAALLQRRITDRYLAALGQPQA